MVLITPTIKSDYPDAFKLAREEKFRVVWVEQDLVYVARRKQGHGRYLVRMFAVPSIDRGYQSKMVCRSTDGAECRGMKFKGMCSHIASVILRSEKKFYRKGEQKAA